LDAGVGSFEASGNLVTAVPGFAACALIGSIKTNALNAQVTANLALMDVLFICNSMYYIDFINRGRNAAYLLKYNNTNV
jgi:hypothetical protein